VLAPFLRSLPYKQEVACSNHALPTILRCFLFNPKFTPGRRLASANLLALGRPFQAQSPEDWGIVISGAGAPPGQRVHPRKRGDYYRGLVKPVDSGAVADQAQRRKAEEHLNAEDFQR